MKTIKNFSDFLLEGGRFGQPVTQPRANTNTNTNNRANTNSNTGNRNNSAPPPAAATTITEDELRKLIAELDGFALYFSNKVSALAKYDANSMEDCDGGWYWPNDDESCYWKIIWNNWSAEGIPAVYAKFAEKVAAFNKLVTDKKIPSTSIELAHQVQFRIGHNLHEANRMNQSELNKLANVPSGKRADTLRGMVMKVINNDDHNFRWTMYYTYTPVIPYGGTTPATVALTSTYAIDCDF